MEKKQNLEARKQLNEWYWPQQAQEAKFFDDSGKIRDALTLQNNQEVQELAFSGVCGNGFGDRTKNRITDENQLWNI